MLIHLLKYLEVVKIILCAFQGLGRIIESGSRLYSEHNIIIILNNTLVRVLISWNYFKETAKNL